MLGHLSDTAVTAPSWISLHALDILPERVGVQSGFQGAVVRHNSHCLHCILIFQEHFEGLIDDAILEGLDVPLVFFIENGLADEEVGEGVREDVNLELQLVTI